MLLPVQVSFGVNNWRGVVKDHQIVQHLVSFGCVGRCAVVEAEKTSGRTPKWVKTISVQPLAGEWERSIAWCGHVAGVDMVGIKSFNKMVSFSTRHDNAQRTSYIHHSLKPINAFFPSAGTGVGSPYIVTSQAKTQEDFHSKYLRAQDEGMTRIVLCFSFTHTFNVVPMYDARRFLDSTNPKKFDYRNYTSSCPRLLYNLPPDSLVGLVHTVQLIPNSEISTDGGSTPRERIMFNLVGIILFASLTSALVE
jgi:hypothetical protein